MKNGQSDYINKGNESNHLKLVCDGSQIEAYVNGHHLVTVEDTTFASGFIGMTAYSHEPKTHVAFDNIKAQSLPEYN